MATQPNSGNPAPDPTAPEDAPGNNPENVSENTQDTAPAASASAAAGEEDSAASAQATQASSAPAAQPAASPSQSEQPARKKALEHKSGARPARKSSGDSSASARARAGAGGGSQQSANSRVVATQTKSYLPPVLLGCTLLLSAAALTLSILSFCQTRTVTPYYNFESNSTNFTEGSIAEVASRVAPAVVSITTEALSSSWFGPSTATYAGTGMIVTSDGYILTNKHVVDGAKSLSVTLDSGDTYDNVKIVAIDSLNDVAYLKIDGVSNLPTVQLGDSKTLSTGQQVIAIGNALGQYQNTITAGVISGTGRSLVACSDSSCQDSETLTDMIQTDAAINSGNSGGPLVNAAGEVIGINTATSDSADGIGFAIPISSAKGMLKSLVESGKAERAYAGVYFQNLTPDIAKLHDLPVSTGAYIYTSSNGTAVIKDGPADKAGLKDGDIITKVSGIPIGNAGSLSTLLGEYKAGDKVQLTIIRDGKEQQVDLTLGSYNTNNTSSSKS